MTCYLCLKSDVDGMQQDDTLPSLFIQSQSWKDRTEGLQLHTRSSSTIPATINKKNSVLRISFRWRGEDFRDNSGHEDSRIVIKVVKESKVLFEIEDWTHPSSHYEFQMIDRWYNSSHDNIKNLEEGCHFELHYAVGGDGNRRLEIEDFELCVVGKFIEDMMI
jgi:hypothetical protein